jgi:hypothetical protein
MLEPATQVAHLLDVRGSRIGSRVRDATDAPAAMPSTMTSMLTSEQRAEIFDGRAHRTGHSPVVS